MPDIRRFIKNGDYFYFGIPPKHTTGVVLNTNNIKFSSVGETYQLTATIQPQGAIEDILTWASSDTSIATVSDTGLVTCVSLGDATITVTTNNGFSASCTVTELKSVYFDFLLVGGGGGGSKAYGGGGGGGGVIQCSNYELIGGNYTVTIGCGGSGLGCACCEDGAPGGYSMFNGIVAYGGGYGGGGLRKGGNGGSGGGAGYQAIAASCIGYGCSGQGYNGGQSVCYGSGGGGGAGGAGAIGTTCYGGLGGAGIQSSITGTARYYSPGGSGHSGYNCNQSGNSTGGAASGLQSSSNATCYGGGGGGAYGLNANYGNGKSGIFVLRYPTSCGYNMTGGTKYTCGAYTIHCFTSSGTLSIN